MESKANTAKHVHVSQRTCCPAVEPPIGAARDDEDTPLLGPIMRKPISARAAALDQDRDAALCMDAVEHTPHEHAIPPGPTTTDEDAHGLASHCLRTADQGLDAATRRCTGMQA